MKDLEIGFVCVGPRDDFGYNQTHAEVCVQTTMREANDRGCGCLLVEDATESYFPAFKAATLEMVRAARASASSHRRNAAKGG